MIAAEVFITCAVTGSADSVRKNPNVPVTPDQIAASARGGACRRRCHRSTFMCAIPSPAWQAAILRFSRGRGKIRSHNRDVI
jgi:hypothetical protein